MKPDCHDCAHAYTHIDFLTRARILICGEYNVLATPKTADDCPEFTPRDDGMGGVMAGGEAP